MNFKKLRQDATSTITGWFTATIVEGSAVRNSKNNPMIKAKLKINGGEYDGRPIWNNFNITPDSPGALRMFFGQMDILGLDENFFDNMPDFGDHPEADLAAAAFIAQALMGRSADIEIGTRQWQGQDREEIKNWRQPGSVGGFGSAAGITPTALPGALPTALPGVASVTPAALPDPPAATEPTTKAPDLPF